MKDRKSANNDLKAADNDLKLAVVLRTLSNLYWYRATTEPHANVRSVYPCSECGHLRDGYHCENCLWMDLAVCHKTTAATKAARKGKR